MARKYRMPDGRVLSFPDDATSDEIEEFINSPDISRDAQTTESAKGPVRRFAESAVNAAVVNPLKTAASLATGGRVFPEQVEPIRQRIRDVASVPGDLARGNYANAAQNALKLVPNMTGSTLGDQVQATRESLAAARRGDVKATTVRGLGTIPGGETVEPIAAQAASGDVAGALGSATGTAAGLLAPKALAPIARRVAPALTRSAQGSALAAAKATPEGQSVSVRTGSGTPLANVEGRVSLIGRAKEAMPSPGRIVAEGAGKAIAGQALRATGIPFAGELAAGGSAIQTIAKLMKTPAWNQLSAATKSTIADLLKSGRAEDAAQAAALASQAIQMQSATNPRDGYLKELMVTDRRER